LLFILLSVRVIGARRQEKQSLGHGESPSLLRRMRVHANFAEYAPLGIVLLGLSESLTTSALLLHGIGGLLLVGRIVHAFGVSQAKENFGFRIAGMLMTFTAIGVAAAICLYGAFLRGFLG